MNSIVRRPQSQAVVPVSQSSPSTWCVGSDGNIPPFPCPPPGWPPPGCPPWFAGANSPPWYPGANAGVSFGTSAPPNPVRGHFWWDGVTLWMFDGAAWVGVGGQGGGGGGGGSGAGTVVIDTKPPGNPVPGMQWWDGTQLRVYDGVTWNVVGPGASPGPVPTTTSVFVLAQPTAISMTANQWLVVPYNAVPNVDTLLGWDSITKKYRPTKAGVYQFFARGYNVAATGEALAIVKNDSGAFGSANSDTILGIDSLFTGSSQTGWLYATGMTIMNGTTDFVRVWAFSASGSWGSIGGNAAIGAWLMP